MAEGQAGTSVRLLDPSTGQIETVAPEAALPALESGKRQLVKGDQVALRAGDGTTALVPVSDVEARIRGDGWAFANRKDILRDKAQDQQLRAAAEGAASALTFGASDYLAKQAGAEGLAERRETAGGAIGEGLGLAASVVGPGLLGKLGVGAAKTVLSAALAPTLALDAAGAAVEQAAGRALGSVVASRAATHAIGTGLGEAVKGAGYGFGGALSEESLGDAPLNAEHLIAGAGFGALLGGGLGGAVGGTRGLLEARASKKALTKLTSAEGAAVVDAAGYSDLPDEAKRGVWGHVQRIFSQASELIGRDGEKIAAVNTPRARAIMHDLGGEVERRGFELKAAMNGLEQNREAVVKAVYDGRGARLQELLPKGDSGSVVGHAADVVDDLRTRFQAFEDDVALGYGSPEAARTALADKRRLVDDFEDSVFKRAGVSREVSVTREYEVPLDNSKELVKRERLADRTYQKELSQWERNQSATAQKPERRPVDISDLPASETRRERVAQQLTLRDLANRTTGLPDAVAEQVFTKLNRMKQVLADSAEFDAKLADVGSRERAGHYRGMHDAVKLHLEDDAVYGAGAEMQRNLNRAYSGLIGAQKRVEDSFRVNRLDEFTGQAMAGYLSKVNKLRGDEALEAIHQWRGAQEAYAAVAGQYFPAAGLVDRTGQALKSFDAAHAKMRTDVGIKTALEDLLRQRQQAAGGGFGYAAGGAIGAAAGPLGLAVGAAAGLVAHAISDPGRLAQAVAAASRTRDRVATALESHAQRLAGIPAAAVELAPRVIAPSTRAILDAKGREDRQAAFDRSVAELQSLAANYEQHASTALVGFEDKLPRHAAAITAQGMAAVQVLLAHVPQPRAGSYTDPYRNLEHSDQDIMRYAQIRRAVEDPTQVYERLADGKPVQQYEVEAVAKAFPRLHTAFQQSVAASLGGGTRRPSYALQRNQRLVFGQPEADPARLRQWQAIHAQQPAPAPRPSQSGKPLAGMSSNKRSQATRLDSYPYGG